MLSIRAACAGRRGGIGAEPDRIYGMLTTKVVLKEGKVVVDKR